MDTRQAVAQAGRILATVSAFAAPAGLAARAPAPSGLPNEDTSRPLDEIVVTAEKRRENLQNLPIAISVLRGEDLQNRHAQSLLDLADGAIPSLRVAPFFNRQSALILNVRGVGVLADPNQPARDQGVGVYIDGVYLGRAQGLGAALFDVENIEVLKGPQGTLFGRNTIGGAVNITTRRPSGEYHLDAALGIGNYGSRKVEAHLDLPSFRNISIKLDGIIARRDGLTRNPLRRASDFNSYSKRGIHAEALWVPRDAFSVDYAFDSSFDATTPLYMQQLAAPAGAPATATSPAIAPFILAAATPVQARRVDVAAVGTLQQPSIGRTSGHRLTLEWDVTPHLKLRSIAAYRELTQSQYDNGTVAATFNSSPTGVFTNASFARYSLAQFRQNQISEELQAVGEVDRTSFVLGALYYLEQVEDSAQAFFVNQFTDAAGSAYRVLPVDFDAEIIQRASATRTRSVGLYGQATYTPSLAGDIVHLTAGARFTHDRKRGRLFTVNGALPVLPLNGVLVRGVIPLRYSESRIDPLITLAVDVTRDIHLYGKYSTGYRSGGASSLSLSYAKFDPETVRMFELGAKMEFLARRARLNLAAYAGTYKSIQLDFSGLYEDVVNGVRVVTTRTTTDTVNAPGAGRLRGFEADLTLAPASGVTVGASYAYNRVRIPDTLNPFPQTGGVFITVPIPIYQIYTPRHSASAEINFETSVAGATGRFHLDANYNSGYYGNYTDVTYDPVTRAVRFALPRGEGAFTVNGRIALADIRTGSLGAELTVALWARNLFDEQHIFFRNGTPTGGLKGFFNDPRTFGVEIAMKF